MKISNRTHRYYLTVQAEGWSGEAITIFCIQITYA